MTGDREPHISERKKKKVESLNIGANSIKSTDKLKKMAFTLSLDVLKSMEDERGLDERERANLWGPHLEGCGRLESVLTFSQRTRQGENIAFLLEMAERQVGTHL